jgi:hypothetical protein
MVDAAECRGCTCSIQSGGEDHQTPLYRTPLICNSQFRIRRYLGHDHVEDSEERVGSWLLLGAVAFGV